MTQNLLFFEKFVQLTHTCGETVKLFEKNELNGKEVI